MKILAFAASLRKGSLNRKLIAVAAELARQEGSEVELAEFRQFEMPMYDGDLEEKSGLPPGALALKEAVEAADALMIACPEYNYSIPGTLKNAIDWVSRARPMPWRGRSLYLMSASPAAAGGIRGLWQARIPFEGCGSFVFPDMFALARAHESFDEDDQLRDPELRDRLQKEIAGFVRLAEASSGICGERTTEKPRREKILVALEDQTEIQAGRQ